MPNTQTKLAALARLHTFLPDLGVPFDLTYIKCRRIETRLVCELGRECVHGSVRGTMYEHVLEHGAGESVAHPEPTNDLAETC
jgi:hypothetical protein